jgi:hypothetical protein
MLRIALQKFGVQSEALYSTQEFKAKLCTRWSSKRSFVQHVGVQSEALYSTQEFFAALCTTVTKLRFELQYHYF